MAGLTLAQAQANLEAANTAYMAALEAESFSISDGNASRSVSRPDLDRLQKAIDYWEKRVGRLSRGGIPVRGATPVG